MSAYRNPPPTAAIFNFATQKYRSSVFARSRHIPVTLNQFTQPHLATIGFISISSSHPHFKVTPRYSFLPDFLTKMLYSHSDSATSHLSEGIGIFIELNHPCARHYGVMRSKGTAPLILNLGAGRTRVVSETPTALSVGKRPR
jgi:hypothetical protein